MMGDRDDPLYTFRFTFSVDPPSHLYSLQVSTHTGRSLPLRNLDSREHLKNIRKDLGEDIEDFKEIIGGQLDLTQDLERVNRAMKRLYLNGRILLGEFLGSGRASRSDSELYEICSDAMTGWPPERPPVIEVRSEAGFVFPFEFLPLLGGYSKYREVRSSEDLMAEAGRYVGFGVIVHRAMATRDAVRSPYSPHHLLLDGDRLPIKLFYCATLRGAREEASFLNLLNKAALVELEGPWPEDPPPGQTPSSEAVKGELGRQLNNPRLSLRDDVRSVEDQVQHFACHCDCGPPDYRGRYFPRIRLAAASGVPSVEVSRRELVGYSMEFPPTEPCRRSDSNHKLPLVFMNACSSSQIDPNGAVSFAEHFLQQGNEGFIGVEAAVPDLAAAEFSRLLYMDLMTGRDVGTAIWAARNRLLRRRANPLGLLYSFYGDPGVCLERVGPRVA